jgi:hypothetical protein
MHMVLHHLQLLYLTILPLADSPYTFFDVLRYGSFQYSKSILGALYDVVAALVDYVRLLLPFRHAFILFAISLTASHQDMTTVKDGGFLWVPEIMAFFFQIFWRHHFAPQTPCQVGDDESGMMARQPRSAVPSPALDQLLPQPNHDHVVPLPSW